MSGTYTFAEFVDYLTMMFGERTDLASVGAVNFYQKWVNMAYIRLTTRNRFWGIKKNFYFPELEVTSSALNTTAGTTYIVTPTDALIIRDVWDSTNDVRLNNISHTKYIKYTGRAVTASRGKPIEWVRQGANIYLYPTPDDAYAMYAYYRKVPAVLTGTNTTAIGKEWDEVILQMAYVIGKEWLGEYEEAATMKKDLAESFAGIIGIYDSEEMARQQIGSATPESASLLDRGYK
jgi:hypothetical protein